MTVTGHVGTHADEGVEFGHEGLAETHDFAIGAALGVEVGTTLGTANGQAGEGILEDLLEAQEFEDAQIHAGMEAQAALVGSESGVELNAVAAVHHELALVGEPAHAEHNGALGFGDALENAVFLVLRIGIENGLKGFKHFLAGLDEFGLACEMVLDVCNNAGRIVHC